MAIDSGSSGGPDTKLDLVSSGSDRHFLPSRTELEDFLLDLWRDILEVESIGINDDFFELGGDWLKGTVLINKLQRRIGEYLYTTALFDAPSVAEFAQYLTKHYSASLAKQFKYTPLSDIQPDISCWEADQVESIDEYCIERMRQSLISFRPQSSDSSPSLQQNPPAVFVLCAPRSGSTLLRVMLGGHPRLFAPPELNLLNFNTLGERQNICSGRYHFMLEGLIRAVMELKGCNLKGAIRLLRDYEQQDVSTQQFYSEIQKMLGNRLLVDKSTAYGLDIETLRHAEGDFENPYYIHLVRHPCGAIQSFEKMRFDQLFFRGMQAFSTRKLAELVWLHCNRNIVIFLNQIPGHRRLLLSYEDLVSRPADVMGTVCRFLGLEFDTEVLHPYRKDSGRMTNGIYLHDMAQGDPKFHGYATIDATVAERWKTDFAPESLANITWRTAADLGYKNPVVTESDSEKPEECIHALFELQAERQPDAIALVSEGQRFTYDELNRLSNQLAHHLWTYGVKPDTIVGLFVERSMFMIAGLLGILKSGAAYVPMDPEYPAERLAFMVEDTHVPVIVSQKSLATRMPEYDAQMIFLDSEEYKTAAETNPASNVSEGNLAYVLYTSGSTGRPKGVMIEHRGAYNTIQAQIRAFGVQESSRVLQFASLNFDTSVVQIFMAFGAGASLIMVNQQNRHSMNGLAQLMRDEDVSHADLPPSVLSVLSCANYPALELVSTGGERCHGEVAARWGRGRRFFYAYGTTETAICSTMLELTVFVEGKLPIGRPIMNVKVYVLDSTMRPVPFGGVGEIYIGGVGIARGYLNLSDLTTASFILDPFSNEPRARMYRTGDLGRCLVDGNIEFMGRIDDQIKIHGHRIEPAEIETVLRQHPAVLEACVVARKDPAGENRLVAYVVSPPVRDRSLQDFLGDKVPYHMVPSAFVFLEGMPRTIANKINRQALPAPDWLQIWATAHDPVHKAPIERTIAAIWQDILGRDNIGLHDNFFDIGGHSLLMTEIHGQLAERVKHDINITDLFRYPTISDLAKYIETGQRQMASARPGQNHMRKEKARAHRVQRQKKRRTQINLRETR